MRILGILLIVWIGVMAFLVPSWFEMKADFGTPLSTFEKIVADLASVTKRWGIFLLVAAIIMVLKGGRVRVEPED